MKEPRELADSGLDKHFTAGGYTFHASAKVLYTAVVLSCAANPATRCCRIA